MSWGERSCTAKPCRMATMESCNVLCRNFTWDQKTMPDSSEMLSKTQRRMMEKQIGAQREPAPITAGKVGE